MSDTGSISSGIASRYATAVFELAKEAKKLPALEKDLDALSAALEESTDFGELITNPVYTRDQIAAAVAAIGKKMKLTSIVANTLGLMAQKRRLFVLPQLVATIKGMIAYEKGEISAEVTSAKALTKAQTDKLAKTLKASVGKDVIVNVSVDESLIGGLIVKVGSKMIDSSIKSKLSNLQNAMKEVG
ncbi:MAG: F0F1 ATP synthase subunit delta [Amylibacter sp.]